MTGYRRLPPEASGTDADNLSFLQVMQQYSVTGLSKSELCLRHVVLDSLNEAGYFDNRSFAEICAITAGRHYDPPDSEKVSMLLKLSINRVTELADMKIPCETDGYLEILKKICSKTAYYRRRTFGTK